MKSIKEKASEYSFVNKGIDETGNYYEDYSVVKLDGFIAGANYVLDHLSKTIAVSKDGYLYDNLKKMIEQLKQI